MNGQAVKKAEPPKQSAVGPSSRNQWPGALDELDLRFDEMCRRWPLPAAFRRGPARLEGPGARRMLKTAWTDRDEAYCIRAEVPGMPPENLDVTIEGSPRTIRVTAASERQQAIHRHRLTLDRRQIPMLKPFSVT